MRHGELVALALLARGPRHAYDLNKEIDAMQVRRWAKLGASTLYRVLERLAKAGLVSVESERVGRRPARKTYALTAKGHEALERHVIEGLRSRAPVYSDRVVAAVFAEVAGPQTKKELETATARLGESLDKLSEIRASETLSPIGRAIIDFQAGVLKAERNALIALAGLATKENKR